MFVGRKDELDSLENLYAKGSFQCVIIYGRRRLGKTTLIKEFAAHKEAIFFTAQEVNDYNNLRLFTELVYSFFNVSPSMGKFEDWNAAFNFIAEKARERRFILIMDEYPYAAQANRELNSIIQNTIDHALKDTGLFLVLCGSQIGFMENEVLGYKSPLFGRRTAQLKIESLNYADAAKLLRGFSPEDMVKTYSCVGGTPYYIVQVDPSRSFEENITALFFTNMGYLYDEPMMLLRQELREPALYNSLITAIASGASKLNDIAQKAGEDPQKASKYLHTLVEMRILRRVYPFGENPAKSRRSIYRIEDNCFAFWYRFVFPLQDAIEKGMGRQGAQKRVFPDLPAYIGKPSFEAICLQYLVLLNRWEQLPFFATQFGTWWGSDPLNHEQTDIDVVLHSETGGEALLGECKWRNEAVGTAELEKLLDKGRLLPGYQKYHYCFFAKSSFTPGAQKLAAEKQVQCVSLADLFRFIDGPGNTFYSKHNGYFN
ncbi:ATPase [Spirochaetia bacterium]|nr:ATPase [Spirochaetia bacterium]